MEGALTGRTEIGILGRAATAFAACGLRYGARRALQIVQQLVEDRRLRSLERLCFRLGYSAAAAFTVATFALRVGPTIVAAHETSLAAPGGGPKATWQRSCQCRSRPVGRFWDFSGGVRQLRARVTRPANKLRHSSAGNWRGPDSGMHDRERVERRMARHDLRDVTFPPGVTGMHTHDLPHVGVIIQGGTLIFKYPDGSSETARLDVGGVGFRDAHVTHQPVNPGPSSVRVIEVELK